MPKSTAPTSGPRPPEDQKQEKVELEAEVTPPPTSGPRPPQDQRR